MSTFLIPARCAARTFSLSPPMGKTVPRKVISPVIAKSLCTGSFINAETSDVAIVIPAEGPSFGIGLPPELRWKAHPSGLRLRAHEYASRVFGRNPLQGQVRSRESAHSSLRLVRILASRHPACR